MHCHVPMLHRPDQHSHRTAAASYEYLSTRVPSLKFSHSPTISFTSFPTNQNCWHRCTTVTWWLVMGAVRERMGERMVRWWLVMGAVCV